MKKFMIIPLLLLAVGCSNETPEQPVKKAYFVQAEEVANTINREMLKDVLTGPEYGQFAPLLQNNVRLIRVTYTTEHPKGSAINVSGALLISENYDAGFPTIVYNHGTYSNRDSGPSVVEIDNLSLTDMDMVLGLAMASAFNCALLMPDYIGYGESKSVSHPYVHVESLGQTGLDFLRAFREYMAGSEAFPPAGDKVFITGYSEGGTAALAVHKAIDSHPEEGFEVVGNVAGSGVYDMLASYEAFFDNQQPVDASILSSYLWLLETYKTAFGYSKDYVEIFSETDYNLLKKVDHDLTYFRSVTEQLPLSGMASDLLRPEFIAGIRDETDTEFISISQQNSLVDFAPKDSVMFVCGDADNWVPPVNSVNAYLAMRKNDCKAGIFMVPGVNHYTTFPAYMGVLLTWLSRLQQSDSENQH